MLVEKKWQKVAAVAAAAMQGSLETLRGAYLHQTTGVTFPKPPQPSNTAPDTWKRGKGWWTTRSKIKFLRKLPEKNMVAIDDVLEAGMQGCSQRQESGSPDLVPWWGWELWDVVQAICKTKVAGMRTLAPKEFSGASQIKGKRAICNLAICAVVWP